MATFAKTVLSGSTNARPIKVAQTTTPGTSIHQGSSSTSVLHEVWLYAMNTHTSALVLTVEWGGTTNPDDRIILTVPAQSGLVLVAPGLLVPGNATPLHVRAFCPSANLITITGFVNTITS